MAADPTAPAFAPEPITEADAAAWEGILIARLRQTAALLRERQVELAPDLRRRIDAFTAALPDLERRAAGFHALVGCVKTRVHGDYHLGQVLRTPDDDWVIIDFEGEPARTIAERRAKRSPLKDVADMNRSFGYARGAALRQLPTPTADGVAQLAAWETTARAAFVAGYRATIARTSLSLAPTADERFAAALAAWELDKALYEIAYELGNRPDWLALPLDALLDPPG
jgi:maltose alpha-D-glucosyltransferase/alpha-amylase